MLQNNEQMNLSPHMAIYDIVVPKDNLLRRINELVDFSFIMDELKGKYCLDNGRNAVHPIRVFKYLVIKSIFGISDIDVVERSQYDMSFKYFLGMAPEDPVIHPSLLTKFRRERLKDVDLLELLIKKTTEIALENGLLKSNTVIVDATHTLSRYRHYSSKEYLQKKSTSIRKRVYSFDRSMKKKMPTKPKTNTVSDEVAYSREMIAVIEKNPKLAAIPAIKEEVNLLKEQIEDVDYHSRYSEDPDAKVGYKSAEQPFHGYKTHLAMSDERLITAAVVTTGEKSDGAYLQELVEKTKQNGMTVDTVIGDTAYSGKDNLIYAETNGFQLVSKLNPVITHGQPNRKKGFTYQKDADTFMCPAGQLAFKKKKISRGNSNQNKQLKYFFNVEVCQACPFQEGCYREGAKSNTYCVRIKSDEHQKQEDFQHSDSFKQLSRERYKIEAKNSELKNRHGFKKAETTGLLGLEMQAATAIFAVNLKRIMKLMEEK